MTTANRWSPDPGETPVHGPMGLAFGIRVLRNRGQDPAIVLKGLQVAAVQTHANRQTSEVAAMNHRLIERGGN